MSFARNEHVVNGVLDVKENLINQDVISLDGAWQFYWNQLLEPKDFIENETLTHQLMHVPEIWDSSTGIDSRGYGTYRLVLNNLNQEREYAFVKKNIRIASKIFVDGKLVCQDGEPSTLKQNEIMGNTPKIIHFFPSNRSVEIIIQVSNFGYYSGGIVESIKFGLFETVEREQKLELIFEVVIFTYLMILSITLAILVIFFPAFRNEKVGSYYMPLAVLAFAIINGSLGERIIKVIFSTISTEFLIRIEYVSISLLLISITATIHWIDKQILSRRVTKTVAIIYAVLMLMVVFSDLNNHYIWNGIAAITIIVLPIEFMLILYRYIRDESIKVDLQEHTLIMFIIYLINIYNLDVLMFTFGFKADLRLAFISAGLFGVIWFLLIIYRYSLTIKKNNELSIQLMESYYDLKKNASAARNNEMAFLQAQIKPHFLFNSLSSIIGLCTRDPKRAQALLLNLSGYLKNLFDIERGTEYIQFDRELDLIKTYVSIEKERFGDRFEFFTEIDQKSSKIKIVPLLIQPLVENGIKHGALKREGDGIVKLSITKEQQHIIVSVEDNGPGLDIGKIMSLTEQESFLESNRIGVGIKNIEDRLMLYYGEKLHFEKWNGMGTRVWFKIEVLEEMGKNDSNNFS